MSELNKESVEQAGGDERAAFEAAFAAMGRPVCRADYDQDAYGTPFDDGGWTGWQARAALAQPSGEVVVTKNESGAIVSVTRQDKEGRVLSVIAESQPSPAQAEQAEAERLREAYEWGYGDGQNNPNGYSDKKERDACVNELLKQPSPAQAEGAPVIGCLCGMPMTEGHHSQDGCSSLEEFAQHSAQAQAEQGEAAGCQGTNCGTTTGDHSPECLAEAAVSQGWELKPEDLGEVEVAAYLATAEHPKHGQPHKAINYFKDPHDAQVAHWRERGCTVTEDQLMTVSQHAARVALWADLFNRVQRERDAALAEVERIKTISDNYYVLCVERQQQLDAAMARVAELEAHCVRLGQGGAERYWENRWRDADARLQELEKQEPVATVAKVPGEDWNSLDFHRDLQDMQPGTKLYTAPVAQAQHSVPVAREQLERLVRILDAHNYAKDAEALMALLAAAPAQAQHSVPELLVRAEDFVSGKEVPQAWLDVQAERRRQITAEGWTPEHDDLYCAAELPRAAAAYILNGANDEAPAIWPFSAKWWKPRDARSNYVRAGALILAEIERLDRAAPGKEVGHE